MRQQNYTVVPVRVILDRRLYPSTKRVFVAMSKYSSRHGTVRKSVDELAALSGCSRATVQKAIAQLRELGFLRRVRSYRYSGFYSRPVFDRNLYSLRSRKPGDDYALIPVELLTAPISHGAFVVALYLYKTAGRMGRSWASLRTIAKHTDLSKATVCRALKALWRLQLTTRLKCRKQNQAYSCNSYYPTSWVRKGGTWVSREKISSKGSLIFSKHKVINKITGSSILRERKYGVHEFGDLYNLRVENLFDDPLYFDGTGVKVSAWDEQILSG